MEDLLAHRKQLKGNGCSQFPEDGGSRNFREKNQSFHISGPETPLMQLSCEEAEARIPIVKGHETVDGRRETSIIPARNSDFL